MIQHSVPIFILSVAVLLSTVTGQERELPVLHTVL